MKRITMAQMLAALAAFLLCPHPTSIGQERHGASPPAASPAAQKWTNLDGKTITAAFVRLDGDRVVLKLADGREVPYLLGKLNASSQTQARKLAAVAAAPAEARAADVQDGKILRQVLYGAIDRKRPKVKLPPGTYRLEADPRNPGDAHLALREVKNVEIDGTGVTLLFANFRDLPGIALYYCKNVTLKGITIDAAPLVFSQGKVAQIAADHSYYDLEMDPAYLLDIGLLREKGRPASVFDPQTRAWKVGVPDFYFQKLEEIARRWRLHLKGDIHPRAGKAGRSGGHPSVRRLP